MSGKVSPGVSPSGEGSTETDGRIGGTPGHLAPEQALHQWDRLGDRTDSFAVGVLLLRIVTGAGLFPAGTPLDAVMTSTAEGRFDDALARLGPAVPLADPIRGCLQVEQDARPAMAEIANAIDAHLTDREAEARRLVEEEQFRVVRAAERAHRWRIILAAGVILAFVAGSAGWQRWSTLTDRAARRLRDDARILQAISDGQSRLNAALGQRSDDPAQAHAALALLREGLRAAERTEAAADVAGPDPRAAFHRFLAESRALLATEQQRADRLAAAKAATDRDQKLSARIVDAFDFDEGAIMASMLGDGNPDPFQFEARIVAALRDCGITVTTLADPRALAELATRPSALRDELALALELWELGLEADDPDRATVLASIERIDPDPGRREIRAVLAANSLLGDLIHPNFVGPPQPLVHRDRLLAVARAALEPRSAPPSLVTLAVGIALIDTPDEKLGLDLFRMITARRPDSAPANLFAASFIALNEPSSYQRAMPYYQALRALRPASGFTMVSTLTREGRGREAEAILDEIERYRGPSPEVDMYRAILLLPNQSLWGRDRLDEAVALMARVVERRPDNAVTHGMFAMLLVKPRRLAEAAEHARESIRRDPRESIGHFVLGILAMHGNNFDEADAQFRAAIRLDGLPAGFPNVMLALCLAMRGRSEEARAFLERADRLESDDAVVQSVRAMVLALMGRDFEAQAICDGVLAGRDEDYAQMARLFLASRARNWVAAEAAALAVIRQEPEEPAWRTLLGMSLNQLGEVDRMIPVYAHLTEVDPENLVHWTMGVSARLVMSDLAGTETQARAALKHFPQTASLHRWLATALVRQRRYGEAIEVDPIG